MFGLKKDLFLETCSQQSILFIMSVLVFLSPVYSSVAMLLRSVLKPLPFNLVLFLAFGLHGDAWAADSSIISTTILRYFFPIKYLVSLTFL